MSSDTPVSPDGHDGGDWCHWGCGGPAQASFDSFLLPIYFYPWGASVHRWVVAHGIGWTAARTSMNLPPVASLQGNVGQGEKTQKGKEALEKNQTPHFQSFLNHSPKLCTENFQVCPSGHLKNPDYHFRVSSKLVRVLLIHLRICSKGTACANAHRDHLHNTLLTLLHTAQRKTFRNLGF